MAGPTTHAVVAALLAIAPIAFGTLEGSQSPRAGSRQAEPGGTHAITDAAVRAEVDGLVARVTAVRHLPCRGLAARPVTRDTVDAQIGAALAARITTSNFGVEERILKRLGLIAAGADYTKLWAAGPASAPVATYDPATQRLLVPDFVPLDAQRVALIHEIAHAVADQRFDLRQFLTPPPPSPLEGDATRARLALVEGDATLAAMEVVDPTLAFLRPTTLSALAERLRAAASDGRPPWLGALGSFVHVDGFLFAAQVRARQPWSAVDALWRDPPDSSEQVLHRDKYEACEAPIAVPESVLPSLPGFDRPKASDVLGELTIRAWLATALPPDVAERAAAGWGGDRAGIYAAAATVTVRPDGGMPVELQPPLVWLTIWDDGGEAEEFAQAAEAIAGNANVQRRGEAVVVFWGPNDLAPAALESTLESWRTSRGEGRRRGRTAAASARGAGRCLRGAR
ncbi:MAG TPA: hypothetical protein VN903_20845 [Polyangia bacterium]|nr:hypothetical protein [Polyangia bacterium]